MGALVISTKNRRADLMGGGESLIRLLISFVILLFVGSCGDSGFPRGPAKEMVISDLEGVYEFISEKTELTKPQPKHEERSTDQWSGTWFFQGGHYSQTMMKTRRGWPPFPTNLQELGYESSVGDYEIKGNLVILRPNLSLAPVGLIQSKTLEFELGGNTLTLTETMTPRLENLSEGTRVTLLRRVK